MGAPSEPLTLPVPLDQLSLSTILALLFHQLLHLITTSLKTHLLLPVLKHIPFYPYLTFFYSSFLRPHTPTCSSQKHALENFYGPQSQAYDLTRARLLHGRESLLGSLAAQMRVRWHHHHHQSSDQDLPQLRQRLHHHRRPIWVDIGGGTGWNIEAMAQHVDVPTFFETVYLVDLSASLCAVAQERFERLGWRNVKVLNEDALAFRVPVLDPRYLRNEGGGGERGGHRVRADLVTMSYSLSMIPGPFRLVDSLVELLKPDGLIGVVDFYVQSSHELIGSSTDGGTVGRAVGWAARSFWRAWFDLDRVSLEAGRRDYLAHRFGTVLEINGRNKKMGWIPYYVWIGCQMGNTTGISAVQMQLQAQIALTEYRDAKEAKVDFADGKNRQLQFSRAGLSLPAVISQPLPSAFYQSPSCPRLHYNPHPQENSPFTSSSTYIYSFTWEDQAIDRQLLRITPTDSILALTSAGDGILHYLLDRPAQIHAVDLNPAQNHLLELKVAAFQSLQPADIWRLFGEGRHSDFPALLLNQLSPFLSSRALQFWVQHGASTFGSSRGLYDTGGSRWALRLIRWLTVALGLRGEVERLCSAPSIELQRAAWREVRPVLVSRLFTAAVIGRSAFLWRALGVPLEQVKLLEADHLADQSFDYGTSCDRLVQRQGSSTAAALARYLTDTLDPVFEHTHLATENYFYLLPLLGTYTPASHPAYLSPQSFSPLRSVLSSGRLQVHTSTILAALQSLPAGALTIAVVMDSMDWFDGESWMGKRDAGVQVEELRRVLKVGGRVLLRSAGRRPWYVALFEEGGFESEAVGVRDGRVPIDR